MERRVYTYHGWIAADDQLFEIFLSFLSPDNTIAISLFVVCLGLATMCYARRRRWSCMIAISRRGSDMTTTPKILESDILNTIYIYIKVNSTHNLINKKTNISKNFEKKILNS